MNAVIIRFPSPVPLATAHLRGTVYIAPCGTAGGSWAVFHDSPGGATTEVGYYLGSDQAAEAAQAYARSTGAEFAA
jgi:hypothetical protein